MNQVSRISRMKAAAVATTCAGLLLGTAGSVLGAGAAAPAPPLAPAPAPQVQPALSWLAAQLTANGGAMPAPVGATKDWGLTADAVLAFTAAGQGSAPAAVTATDLLTTNAAAYTTWDYQGATIRDAGPTGKSVLTLRSMGRPAVAGGVDLQAALRGLMRTSGAQAGRFSDGVPGGEWDTSNGFSQTLSMLGLALTPDGMPAPAVTFLAAQQCPAGGFRLTYGTSPGCTDDGAADTDASALSIMALLNASPRTPQVTTALQRGTQWLLSRQASDGSFGGTGPTAAPNANSSGLVAQALRAAGHTAAADKAAAWISGCCQLSVANATGTPAAPNIGALAYNPAARTAALASGISAQAGDQWRRSTTQAVLAFGLAPYGPHDVAPIVVPPTSTSTTTSSTSTTSTSTSSTSTSSTTSSTSSTSTSSTTSSTSSTSTTSTSTTSSTVPAAPSSTTPPSTAPAQVEGAQVEGAQVEGSSPSSPVSASAKLATTGLDPAVLLAVAVVLLTAGAALSTVDRRGRR